MRGSDSIRQFASAMRDTLNLPKNAKKGDWSDMTLQQLREKLAEEFEEVMIELDIIVAGGSSSDLIHETVDLACVAMMLREFAITHLIRERKEA